MPRYFFSSDFLNRLSPYAVLCAFHTIVLATLNINPATSSIGATLFVAGALTAMPAMVLAGSYYGPVKIPHEQYWLRFVVWVMAVEFVWLCFVKFGAGSSHEMKTGASFLLVIVTVMNGYNIWRLSDTRPFSASEMLLMFVSMAVPVAVAYDAGLVGDGTILAKGPLGPTIVLAALVAGILVPMLVIWATGPKRATASA